MRALLASLAILVICGSASAGKEPGTEPAHGMRVPCALTAVGHDWDFSAGDQGFAVTECSDGGLTAWEWGPTSYVPGAPSRVWATRLSGGYLDNSGGRLRSPGFVVDAANRLLEIHHYFDTEPEYDGCNVRIVAAGITTVIEPLGGYSVTEISPSALYHAFCVDGEPGWTGHDATWRIDCFDLSPFFGQAVRVELAFGADASTTAAGWYVSRIRTGTDAPPSRACCDLRTGECQVIAEAPCREGGREWHPEWPACAPNPCPQPIPSGLLRLGNYFNPEPWHNWVSGMPGSPIEVEVHPADVPGTIQSVDFFWSRDLGATWELFGSDTDGSEPYLDTYAPGVQPAGDGWSAVAVTPLPIPEPVLKFKTLVHTTAGEFVLTGEREVDPAPPSLGRTSIDDWVTTDKDTMGVYTDPNGCEVSRLVIYRLFGGDVVTKGVPGINQHVVSEYHCAPTAAAQCLKYFEENHGDTEVTGGLDDSGLVGALGAAMRTNLVDGTHVSDWSGGLASWIANHGNGYTVRLQTAYNAAGLPTWTRTHWTTIRNELERCQDVMLGLFWQGGGGHAVTLDAISNYPLGNGRTLLAFKDPYTGLTSTGELATDTGHMYNISGAGGGGGGYVAATMIVCPAESTAAGREMGTRVYDGDPPGSPPYYTPVPLPETGIWFIHEVIVNNLGHAATISRLVVRAAPGAAPLPGAPAPLALGPARPNPFAGSTEITFSLPKAAAVRLVVFDVAGRAVRTLVDGETGAGIHRTAWNGTDDRGRPVPAGTYYARIRTAGLERTLPITLLR
jgi:hypothetical protein